MKEIWVLTTDWAHDGEIGDNAELYEKEETARKKFQQVVKEIRSNYSHVDFNAPDCDYNIDEDENSLEIYLKGYYFSDSQAVVLTKMPVITD